MKNKFLLLGLFLTIGLTGCQNIQFPNDTKTGQTNLVTVVNVDSTTGHGKISDTFNIDQRVCGYLTHYVDTGKTPKSYDVSWYSGDKLVIKTAYESKGAKRSPHFLWTCIDASELGAGSGKVEISTDNQALATAKFMVTRKP